jgi:6-phosphogluconolactonase (cycloisomerase 2 family)
MNRGRFGFLSVVAVIILFSVKSLPAAFLYVVNPHQSIVGFSIDSTGSLQPIPGSPFSVDAQSMSVNPTGTFAYAANEDTGTVLAYRIVSDGSLIFISSYAAGVPSTVTTDPSGNFVYVTNINTGQIYGFQIQSAGALTSVPGSPFSVGSAPYVVAIEPVREFMYISKDIAVSQPGKPTKPKYLLSAYSIQSDGSLSALPKLHSTPPKVTNSQAAADPNGKFIFGAINGHDISGFGVGTEGDLKPLAHSLFSVPSGPVTLAADPSGQFLYVADFNQGEVSAFAIDASNGSLKPAPGSPFVAGIGPNTMGIDPTNTFLYVANADSSSISGYRINSGGVLTPIPGSPFILTPSAEPLSLVIAP